MNKRNMKEIGKNNIITKQEIMPVVAILIARRAQKKCLKHTQNGITLVALVITIIVLLILAGVTINLTLGERGIFKTAQSAGEKSKIAEYKEKVELARIEVASKNMGKVTLDNLIEQIYVDKVVQRGDIVKIDDIKATMTTREEYVFLITGDKVEYIDKKRITPPEDTIISFSGSTTTITLPETINASVELNDSAFGINISKSKWILNKEEENIGTDENLYTGKFTSENDTIDIELVETGEYFLHVLSTNNIGERKETVSSEINVEPVYHSHTGNTSSGGGCFGNPVLAEHMHQPSCYRDDDFSCGACHRWPQVAYR